MNESGILSSGTAKMEADPLRILFVDDNAEVAKVMAKTIVELGHYASWASSESEAKVMLQAETPDGLVTDYSLDPEKVQGGGGRLAAMLHSGGKNVPCIVITGFSPVGELASVTAVLEALGNVMVLHKPQDPASLLSMLKGLRDAQVPAANVAAIAVQAAEAKAIVVAAGASALKMRDTATARANTEAVRENTEAVEANTKAVAAAKDEDAVS